MNTCLLSPCWPRRRVGLLAAEAYIHLARRAFGFVRDARRLSRQDLPARSAPRVYVGERLWGGGVGGGSSCVVCGTAMPSRAHSPTLVFRSLLFDRLPRTLSRGESVRARWATSFNEAAEIKRAHRNLRAFAMRFSCRPSRAAVRRPGELLRGAGCRPRERRGRRR